MFRFLGIENIFRGGAILINCRDCLVSCSFCRFQVKRSGLESNLLEAIFYLGFLGFPIKKASMTLVLLSLMAKSQLGDNYSKSMVVD